jgi:hypothetical protein
MTRQSPVQSSPPGHLARAVARGKRHRHIVILLRLLMVIGLVGATAIWRRASADVVTSTAATPAANLMQSTTVNPQTVSAGSQVAITTKVTALQTWVSNGIIDIEVYDANNVKVGQQYFTGQYIGVSRSVSQTYTWAATASGTYRVAVGVFAKGWSSMLFWANAAASVTVVSSNASLVLNQTTLVSGSAPANISTTVSDASGSVSNGIIDIEVYNAANQKISQQSFSGQNLSSGQSMTHNIQWMPPAAGTYRVAVGVFGANWAPTLLWSDNAASLAVNGPTSTPIPATATTVLGTSTPVNATSTTVVPTSTPVPPTATKTSIPGPTTAGCRFQTADQPLNVAFCDTFNAPAGTGNRSGDLSGMVWGTSRLSEDVNPGQGAFDAWFPVSRNTCGASQLVQPEHDIAVCNGQMVEATNDGGNFTTLATYPTQPFDIAGRTGTVVFDVSADSEGPHAAWPSFVYTDQPVPAPYSHHPGTAAYARNSFGFALAANAPCGTGTTGLDEVFATSDYVLRTLTVTPVNPCLTYQAGALNHFEVRISQSRVEVWGTNAGSTSLQELGYVANAGLTLTRGLIWMEDQHYNADKFNDQGTHTFTWDNVGFDGPTLPRDLHLDVSDALTPNSDGSLNLGWYAPDPSGGTPLTLQVPGAANLAQASAAIATLNFWPTDTSSLLYRVNGNAWHTLAWPFPDGLTYCWRTIALPVPLTELHAGANTLDLQATKGGTTVANVDLILVGARGARVR